MRRKILAILVSMLFISMIPSVIGEIADSDIEDDWVYMRGLIMRRSRVGNLINALAIHLVVWYNTSLGFQREVYWFKWIILRDSAYMGRMYEIGLGLFTYIIGFFEGLEIE